MKRFRPTTTRDALCHCAPIPRGLRAALPPTLVAEYHAALALMKKARRAEYRAETPTQLHAGRDTFRAAYAIADDLRLRLLAVLDVVETPARPPRGPSPATLGARAARADDERRAR